MSQSSLVVDFDLVNPSNTRAYIDGKLLGSLASIFVSITGADQTMVTILQERGMKPHIVAIFVSGKLTYESEPGLRFADGTMVSK